MIEVLIFHLHIVCALFVFTKYWQKGGMKEGLMGVGLFAIMFSIGWVITSFFAKFAMPDKWITPFFTRDTLALVLLLIPEIFFYKNFFLKDKG